MTQPKSLLYMFCDFASLNIALIITYFLVFDETGFFLTLDFRVIALLVNLLWFAILFYSNEIYTKFEYKGFGDEIKNFIPNFFLYTFFFYVFSILLFHKIAFPFAIYYAYLFLLMVTSRFLIRMAVSYRPLNYITIGYCTALPKIEAALNEAHNGKTHLLGAFGGSSVHQNKHLGTVDKIDAFLGQNKVNMILYVSNSMGTEALRQLMHFAKYNFIEFKIISLELDCLTEGAKFELHHGVFLSAKDVYVAHLRSFAVKRLFDIVFSALVIVGILSWLMPLIAFLIKLESPSKGPVLFFQNRIGFQGKMFRCIKFRTMSVQENGGVVKQAERGDCRVTKVGAFLRRTNLDEMPQFFNVFFGDMSVVGPRPHAVAHDVAFQNAKEEYILRHYMKPGITGWAQVNGWRGPTDTDHKISGRTSFDLWYVQHGSLWLDIKIVFLTVFGSKAWEEAF
jgi:putative colanic acid biosysnthesis UDP-glucose lipid carrier transferase